MINIRIGLCLIISSLILGACSTPKSKGSIKYFVKVTMVKENAHLTSFSGLTDNVDFENLELDDYENCINSLYRHMNYTPSFFVYNNVLKQYLKKSNDNIKKNNFIVSEMYNVNVDGSYKVLRKRTKDGYVLIIKITKMKGAFVSFDKDYIKLPFTSSEVDPYTIESIHKVILPIDFKVIRTAGSSSSF